MPVHVMPSSTPQSIVYELINFRFQENLTENYLWNWDPYRVEEAAIAAAPCTMARIGETIH